MNLQNVYMATEDVEEPEFQYVPDTPHVSPLVPGTQALSQSMLLLEESLDTGAISSQFEQLYRKNTALAMSICHKEVNLGKNRYRDISPYNYRCAAMAGYTRMLPPPLPPEPPPLPLLPRPYPLLRRLWSPS